MGDLQNDLFIPALNMSLTASMAMAASQTTAAHTRRRCLAFSDWPYKSTCSKRFAEIR